MGRWITVMAVLAMVSSPGLSAPPDCAVLAKRAETDAGILSPPLGYLATGKGRLYFYSAPHEGCKTEVFIIPGDHVTAYARHDRGWIQVMYSNGNMDRDDPEGWVKEGQLKYTGTMGHQ